MIKIRSRTNKVPRFVPISCTSFSPHDLKYGSKMSSKLDEIARKLNDLLMEEIVLGLIENVETSNRTSRWLEEASMVNLSVIFILGRDGDKKALLGEEICDEKVTIVSIVGLGGIGKIIITQVLNGDKDHFKLMAWVSRKQTLIHIQLSNHIVKKCGGLPLDLITLWRVLTT
ncbi:hypothetical protein E3N88_27167 [Mikania micrantha]|uniref:NB-ARC domain-containing protein n=1 Tax=Mikania micrantha TaxID=192012 RepID=A0A5N6MWS3_9ASTR|nr:hypothetical protein E3N88_27167 [Mikania micrantha]